MEDNKLYDICFPTSCFQFFDGPSCSMDDVWRNSGHCTLDGGLAVGTINRFGDLPDADSEWKKEDPKGPELIREGQREMKGLQTARDGPPSELPK
eukprot:8905265-Alexandrium_andersonii.AAC.1